MFSEIFETSRAAKNNISSMEGLRGFAVLLVYMVHFGLFFRPWIDTDSNTFLIIDHLRSVGNSGVDLFFVLSGFLIYGMLIEKSKPIKNYIVKRIVRIYPTFIVILVIYIALSFIFPSVSKIPPTFSEGSLYILQNILLLPGMADIEPIVTVSWSLSYELFYYIITPFVINCFFMRFWSRGQRIVFIAISSILVFAYFAVFGGPIRLVMFLAGILLYEVVNSKPKIDLSSIGLISIVLLVLSPIIAGETEAGFLGQVVLLYFIFFALCFDCFSGKGVCTRLFSFSMLRWLGNMSYSFYLCHGLALHLVVEILERIYPARQMDSLSVWIFLPISFVFALVPSALLFVLIEKPLSLRFAKSSEKSPRRMQGLESAPVSLDITGPHGPLDGSPDNR